MGVRLAAPQAYFLTAITSINRIYKLQIKIAHQYAFVYCYKNRNDRILCVKAESKLQAIWLQEFLFLRKYGLHCPPQCKMAIV